MTEPSQRRRQILYLIAQFLEAEGYGSAEEISMLLGQFRTMGDGMRAQMVKYAINRDFDEEEES